LIFILASAYISLSFLHFQTAPQKAEAATLDLPVTETTPQPTQMPLAELITNGSRDKKQIALTFDADMTLGMMASLQSHQVASLYDDKLIAILNDTKTPATLFLSGLWIEAYPDVTKALAKNPLFELGNHTYTHPSFSGDCYGLRQITDEEKPQEIDKTNQLLKDVAGIDNILFRFPGGCYAQKDLDLVKTKGLLAIQWDVVADDGFNNDAEAIYNKVVPNVQNGSILIFHMNGDPNEPQTANVIAKIIPALREKGFTFVTISDLLK
jgi:peptidoglycan/xylan/chitin deacetylase (PgdA/CDA1 family)